MLAGRVLNGALISCASGVETVVCEGWLDGTGLAALVADVEKSLAYGFNGNDWWN